MIPRACFGFLMLVLGGCVDGGHWMSSEYLTGRGWAKQPEPQVQPPIYCYRTLGEVNCYRSPQVGQGRLIEFIQPQSRGDAHGVYADSPYPAFPPAPSGTLAPPPGSSVSASAPTGGEPLILTGAS